MHSTGESQTNDLAVGRAHPPEVSAAALRDTGPGRCPATRLCSSSGAEMSTQPSLPALATRVSPPGAGDTGDRVDRRAAERPDCRMRAHTGREPGCAQSASVGPTVARRTRGVLEAPQRSPLPSVRHGRGTSGKCRRRQVSAIGSRTSSVPPTGQRPSPLSRRRSGRRSGNRLGRRHAPPGPRRHRRAYRHSHYGWHWAAPLVERICDVCQTPSAFLSSLVLYWT